MARDIRFVELQLVQILIANTCTLIGATIHTCSFQAISTHGSLVSALHIIVVDKVHRIIIYLQFYTQRYLQFQCHLSLTPESPLLHNPTSMQKKNKYMFKYNC